MLKNEDLKNIYIIQGCSEFFNKDKKIIKNKKDNLVITLDCNFLEFNHQKQKSATILDLGQSVNLYNLIRLIFALSGKLKKDINELPLKIIVNLYNSETISSLLMLLSLGFMNIKINSDLPNYLTDNLISAFEHDFNLQNVFSEEYWDLNRKNQIG